MNGIILTNKEEYNYFEGFLDSLHSLANKELQERVWGSGDYFVYTSFDEIYMHFSDLCEDILTADF